jgi:hypothetical protein
MRVKSRVAAFRDSSKEGTVFPRAQETKRIKLVKQTAKSRETKLDHLFAAGIYGLSAFFVIFILGFVTGYIPNIFYNVALSTLMGSCAGVIVYSLMVVGDSSKD